MNSLKAAWDKLFEWRFYVLLLVLILMIVLPGFFDQQTNDRIVWPFTRTLLLVAGLNIIRHMNRGIIIMATLGLLATSSDWIGRLEMSSDHVGLTSLLLFSLFTTIVTYEGFRQLVNSKQVDSHSIAGAFDGFLMIGLIGALIYSFIHLLYPDSYLGVRPGFEGLNDLIYFSYITVLTIGYGDIVPNSEAVRRISILLGLIGQFYLVVVMAVLVGKYIGDNQQK